MSFFCDVAISFGIALIGAGTELFGAALSVVRGMRPERPSISHEHLLFNLTCSNLHTSTSSLTFIHLLGFHRLSNVSRFINPGSYSPLPTSAALTTICFISYPCQAPSERFEFMARCMTRLLLPPSKLGACVGPRDSTYFSLRAAPIPLKFKGPPIKINQSSVPPPRPPLHLGPPARFLPPSQARGDPPAAGPSQVCYGT